MFGLLVLAIRAFYLCSAAAILIVCLVPACRDRYLAYGARDVSPTAAGSQRQTPHTGTPRVSAVLDWAATITVPHSWFIHFYLLSIASSVACYYFLHEQTASGLLDQARLGWALMLMQGWRRLYECLVLFSKKSRSRMWIGHYLAGLAFYLATNLAIWVEHLSDHDGVMSVHPVKPMLSLKNCVGIALFLAASATQHYCHSYLSGLRKYTLPNHGLFKFIVAPHYTAECVIYGSLAILNAPRGNAFNWTLVCALVFVLVNLGVTANGTRGWMAAKFPESREHILARWRIVPLIW